MSHFQNQWILSFKTGKLNGGSLTDSFPVQRFVSNQLHESLTDDDANPNPSTSAVVGEVKELHNKTELAMYELCVSSQQLPGILEQ